MAMTPAANPYVGPRAFRRDETMYGRDREARDLFDLLVSERIVLLHSPSGAGKSSLIQAALIPHLTAEDEGFRVLPLIRVNEPPRWPVANRYIYSMLHSLENMVPAGERLPIEQLAQLSLAEYLAQRLPAPDAAQSIVFIFDQFEEILNLDPTDGEVKADFFTQVGYALRDQQRWALFAMREDYLGALEPYRRFVPTRLDNAFRLELLGPAAADQAIQQPALSCGVDFQLAAVQQLRDDLRKMRLQQPDGETVERLGPHIEPVQLQVVCSRLWEEYSASGTITLEHVKAIGNVDEALAAYYAASVKAAALKASVPERIVRDWFAQHLITRQGLRGQVLREPDESGSLRNDAIEALIEEHLVRREERSGATWYELAHDRLIDPVERDNARWFDQQLSPLQKRAAEWSQQGEPTYLLFSGLDLAQAEQWAADHAAELSKIEHKFLKECREARALEEQRIRNAEERAEFERQRAEQEARAAARLRGRNRIILGLAAVALAAALVAVYGFISAAQSAQGIGELAGKVAESADQAKAAAAEAERSAKIAEERQQAAEAAQKRAETAQQQADAEKAAADALRDETERRNRSLQLADYVDDVGRPDLAILLSLEAQRIADTVEARASLLSALQSNGHLAQYLQHTQGAPFYSAAISPRNSLVAAGGSVANSDQGVIRVWDRTTGKLLTTTTTPRPSIALTFIDQEQLVAKDIDGSLTRWNLPDGASASFESRGSLDQSSALAISPDRQRLAASSNDNIYVWDLGISRIITELITPGIAVSQLVFDPVIPTSLAAGYSDGSLRLWDVTTGQATAETSAPNGLPIAALRFDDSRLLAYVSGLVIDWTPSLDITQTITVDNTDPLAVLIQPAMTFIASADQRPGNAVALRQIGADASETLKAHSDQITGLIASSDGGWLVSTGVNGEVVLWRMWGDPLATDLLDFTGNMGMVFGPDRQLVAVESNSITWWEAASADFSAWQPLTDVTSLAASLEHDRLALGNIDGSVELWSSAQQQPIAQPITGYVAPLKQLAFSADGQWLAGLDDSGYLSVTELAAGQSWQPQNDLSVGVKSMTFHPRKPGLLALGRDNGFVEMHDVTTGRLTTAPLTTTNDTPVELLAFSHAGRLLAASKPNEIRLLDLQTGSPLPTLQIEGDTVTSLLFNRDDKTLITGLADGAIILWDIASGRRLGTLREHASQVRALALDPGGQVLASSSEEGVVLWRIDTEEWKRIACRTSGRDLTDKEWERYFRDTPYHATCSDLPE
jgi:WD40 repeat protein